MTCCCCSLTWTVAAKRFEIDAVKKRMQINSENVLNIIYSIKNKHILQNELLNYPAKRGSRSFYCKYLSNLVVWKRCPRLSAHSPKLFQFHRPVSMIEKLFPGLVFFVAKANWKCGMIFGLHRLGNQFHVRLLWRAPAFFTVTRHAATHKIRPRRTAALRPRHHMI